jgi:hypothetical protein
LHERLDCTWQVTESKIFKDSLNGEDREVDIVLESTVGSHSIILSIECRDHKRKADTLWIESMAKKHESLPTSKLVLWSASGFYKPAIVKANKLNIDTISSGPVESLQWAVLANQLKKGSIKLLNTDLSFLIDVETPEGTKKRLEDEINYLFKEVKSGNTFNINDLKNKIASDMGVASILLDHATLEKSNFWIQYTHPVECVVQDENQQWYKLSRIGIGVKARVQYSKLETKSVVYQNKVTTLALGKFGNKKIEIFVEEKAPVVILKIGK